MSLDDTIQILKAAAEPTRFRLLSLCARGPVSVGELVDILGQSQPRISRHLKLLANAGLVERQQNGRFVFYRVPQTGESLRRVRTVLSLIDSNDGKLEADLESLIQRTAKEVPSSVQAQRLFNRAILDIAATGSIGSLLDIGVGSARILKLLGSYATRLVGIDNNRIARQTARATLQSAGLTNCSVLNGDMYQLPFDYGEFDTVIMDEVLYSSDEPVYALIEAVRTLTARGRLIILEKCQPDELQRAGSTISDWLTQTHLKLSSLRSVDGGTTRFLIVVATKPHA